MSGPGVSTGVSIESYYTNIQVDGAHKADPAAQGLNGWNIAPGPALFSITDVIWRPCD